MQDRRLALIAALTLLCPKPVLAQRNQQQAYRPPPPPAYRPPPPPPAANDNRRYGGSSSNGSSASSFRSPTPSPSQSFRAPAAGPTAPRNYGGAFNPAQGGGANRMGTPANDNNRFRSPTGGTGQAFGNAGNGGSNATSLRSRFAAGGDGKLPTSTRSTGTAANASTASFGTQVKSQVGSGTATSANGSSGLRERFHKAGGGGHPPGSLTARFNAAASSGEGRIGGQQSPELKPKPKATDPFGATALAAEKQSAFAAALKDGKKKHEDSQKPKPPAPQP